MGSWNDGSEVLTLSQNVTKIAIMQQIDFTLVMSFILADLRRTANFVQRHGLRK
jgi:hypothetical protein